MEKTVKPSYIAGCLAALAPLLLAAPSRATPNATLAPGFGKISLSNAAYHVDIFSDDLGALAEPMNMCSNSAALISRKPTFTVTIQTRLRARMLLARTTAWDAKSDQRRVLWAGSRISMPGNAIHCLERDDVTMTFEPGTYEFHLPGYCDQPAWKEAAQREACPALDVPAGTYRLEFEDLSPANEAISDDFPENPIAITKIRIDEQSVGTLERFGTKCADVYDTKTTEEPGRRVVLARPHAKLRITLVSGVTNVLVTDARGRSRCAPWRQDGTLKSIELDDVPAGPLDIRAVGPTTGRDGFGVAIADLSLPFRRATSGDVRRQPLDKGMPSPLTLRIEPSARGPVTQTCMRIDTTLATFRAVPDLILDVARPLADASIVVRPSKVIYRLEGPFGSHGELLPTTRGGCDGGGRSNLDIGRYEIYLAAPSEPLVAPATVLFATADMPPPPMLQVGEPDKGSRIEARGLDEFYPYLDPMPLPIADLKTLFAQVPSGLLLFPRFDLDATSAYSPTKALTFPTRDEPLLATSFSLLSDRIVTVVALDGMLFKVDLKHLTTEHTGPVRLPDPGRWTPLTLGEARGLAEGKELEPFARFDPRVRRARECESAQLAKEAPTVAVVERRGDRSWVELKHSSEAKSRAWKACGGDELERDGESIARAIDVSYQARYRKGLAALRARFASDHP